MLGTHGPLVAVVLALLAAGLGVPLPEDLSLLGAGYLVWSGQASLWVVIPICLVAIVAGDTALFWLGWHFGPAITRHRLLRHRLTPRRLERVERHFERHGAKTILIGRFAAGARALFFLAAGAMKMSFWRFLLMDGIAAGISGTAWILLGWRFGAQIDWIRHFVHRIEHIAVLVLALCLVGWLITRSFRRRIAGPPLPEE
jgi:membrane protein DedA with SNARE-associated domain